ncbi:MAG: radical SAM protein [Treponema sp.]|nr:radical SAM protein [Treponema sp.]
MDLYAPCNLCPRRCGVNRNAGERGFCGESAGLRVACAAIHCGEEPPVTGRGGSGAIFVSGCNLGCVFCQNFQISRAARRPAAPGVFSESPETTPCLGRAVTAEDFAEICAALQERGAENINIVTGSHAVPAIAEGLRAAKTGRVRPGKPERARLAIPVLWNSSAYELPETLELLAGLAGAFLPDMKTLDGAVAARYFRAPDYPETARAAILKMIDMAGDKRTETGLYSVIVRHLVLPGHLDSTKDVLRWFAEECSGRKGVGLSLMFQYTVMDRAGSRNSGAIRKPGPERSAVPGRPVSGDEYRAVMGWLDEYGIEDGYCQEPVSAGGDWLPDFENDNPFPSALSVPVWHWRAGFLSKP